MTVPSTGLSEQPEDAAVIVIDMRACATGPDAAEPEDIDERTLEERQRHSHVGDAGTSSGWRIINFERLLVVDDATVLARHEDAYRHLVEAPTFGRMLCLAIGAPSDPPYLDLPKALDAARAPVLWLGDARGVGWQIGRANTTRLAFSDSDPDGSVTVANLVESLMSPGVFDEIAKAISGLPDRTGVPALLPWARWPPAECDAAGTDHQLGDQPTDGGPESPTADAVPDRSDDHEARGWRSRQWAAALLLALGCAVIAVAILLAIRPTRPSVGYVVADAGCAAVVLLGLFAIARRMLATSAVTRLDRIPDSSASPPTPQAEMPRAAAPPSEEVIASARWMMNASVADEAFRQLSSPEQLVMLAGESELARLVRFAPATSRPLIEHAIDGDSISWTLAGDYLGVIRLIPMKAGLVRQRGA